MAEIMEFLLNLLLIRGKFLTTKAADAVHEAIKKCLEYKQKLTVDYSQGTQTINMLEFFNEKSSEYKCEDSFVVVNELPEEHQKKRQAAPQEGKIQSARTASKHVELPRHPQTQEVRHRQSKDGLVDNFHAILKSQEFLFKNMSKLIEMLEKNEQVNIKKMKTIKEQLQACTNILSNKEEARRLSSGDCKPSRPAGIEIALETNKSAEDPSVVYHHIRRGKARRHDMEVELKTNLYNYLRRSESDPTISITTTKTKKMTTRRDLDEFLKQTRTDIENSMKLIEVSEQHFKKFENDLWHSLTTTKFLALKEEYLNLCKCAFYNKRQFMATESAIAKRNEEMEAENFRNFLKMSEAIFREVEGRILLESLKRRQREEKLEEQFAVQKLYEFPPQDIEERAIEKIEIGSFEEDLKKLKSIPKEIWPVPKEAQAPRSLQKIQPIPEGTLSSVLEQLRKEINRRERRTGRIYPIPGDVDSEGRSSEKVKVEEEPPKKDMIGTIILRPTSLVMPELPPPEASKIPKIERKIYPIPIKTKSEILQITKLRTDSSGQSEENQPPRGVLSDPTLAKLKIVETSLQSVPEPLAKDTKLLVTATTAGKLVAAPPPTTKTVSSEDLKTSADLIDVNQKAFQELESAVRTVQIFIEKPASSSKSIRTTTEGKKRKIDEPVKKSMSTNHLKIDRYRLYKELKEATKNSVKEDRKETHSMAGSLEIVESSKSNSHMRRTTKNAMKRQQVVTIFPKVSKKGDEKKRPQVTLVETEEMKRSRQIAGTKVWKSTNEVNLGAVMRSSTSKRALSNTSKPNGQFKGKEKVHCVKWEENDNPEIVKMLKS